MEHTSGKAPRTSRPVDVACFGCFHPAQASTSARSGHEAALGTPLRHRSPDTCAGPSRSFGAFGRARHTRQAAETLWALSGAAQRAPLRTGQALSGRQEGRLNPHEDRKRGSFARGFISSPKLSCLKRKLRASASRLRAPRFISGTWNAKSSGKLLKLSEVKEHLHARNLTIHHRPYMGAVRRPVARTRGGSPFGLSQSPHTR